MLPRESTGPRKHFTRWRASGRVNGYGVLNCLDDPPDHANTMTPPTAHDQPNSIQPLPQESRIIALGLNVAIAWVILFLATGSVIPSSSGASVWFFAATAYWLLSLVAAPFFLPPRDALSTAIAVVLLLAPLDLSSVGILRDAVALTRAVGIVLAVFVGLAALVAAFRINTGLGRVAYRLSSALGKGEILFTPVVIMSAVGYYQTNIPWMIMILAFWVFVVMARPVELLLQMARYLSGLRVSTGASHLVGTILRVDDPDIVRVALNSETTGWNTNAVHIARLSTGGSTYVLPLFMQIQDGGMVGTGLCCPIDDGADLPPIGDIGSVHSIDRAGLGDQLSATLSGNGGPNKIVGIVAEGSSISAIRFQVVRAPVLEEGMVVFSVVRGQKVYYQILDASTSEENFQQNPLGVHIVSAAQLGCYDPEYGFKKFPWLPSMNQPLFLLSSEAQEEMVLAYNEFVIGDIPSTPFKVAVVLDDLIEYHTAVLGVTGTGKTELALDIIKNALDRGTKVFCVDFTGEYRFRLGDRGPHSIGLTIEQGSDLETLLFAVESGEFGAKKEKAALKEFIDSIKPQVVDQIEGFLTNPEQRLGIFELAEITNTKATLRTTELYLSAIMDWARKNRKAERILIVLEEAHTIIPESYGSGFDAETQWVVSRIGQIALQGRKYGVGLLLVSQRTALVSKTVLSQCNTFFTHALIDRTSLDFLGSVYSAEHVRALPNLRFLEFVAHGKAVKSERPLLAQRAFDPEKLKQDQALNAPKI